MKTLVDSVSGAILVLRCLGLRTVEVVNLYIVVYLYIEVRGLLRNFNLGQFRKLFFRQLEGDQSHLSVLLVQCHGRVLASWHEGLFRLGTKDFFAHLQAVNKRRRSKMVIQGWSWCVIMGTEERGPSAYTLPISELSLPHVPIAKVLVSQRACVLAAPRSLSFVRFNLGINLFVKQRRAPELLRLLSYPGGRPSLPRAGNTCEVFWNGDQLVQRRFRACWPVSVHGPRLSRFGA